jgi:hypothetical protein
MQFFSLANLKYFSQIVDDLSINKMKQKPQSNLLITFCNY